MENFLRSKEYWGLVETGYVEPESGVAQTEAQRKGLDELKLKDLKVKNYLFQAIDRVTLETILKKDTAKEIWDSLKQKFSGTARVKRAQLQALRREFEILAMKEGETVDEYFGRTLVIANKMRLHGERMEDVVIVEKILRSMTPKFAYVVCSIEESRDVTTLSVDDLQSSLLVHEQRMTSSVVEEKLLKASLGEDTRRETTFPYGRGRGRGRGYGRGRGRWRDTQASKQEGTWDKSNVECFRCHKRGHYQYECPDLAGKEETNFVESEEVLLMAYVQKEEATNSEIWYLDSGCSNHMSGNKSLFSELNETFREHVKLGDNSTVAVMGKGNIHIHFDKHVCKLTDVFYIPNLKNNLISMGQLHEHGYNMRLESGCWQIQHSSEGLITKVMMTRNRMFPFHSPRPVSRCLSARVQDNNWLWHCRYGHLNFSGLKTLYQKNMVIGLPPIQLQTDICDECTVGKQPCDSFPTAPAWRAEHILELVHSDLCGPIHPASCSGKRYFLTFIDDYSRKTWVYLLHEKSEAFAAFQSFKSKVEKMTDYSIKCLRTDRGGEFNSRAFVTYCEQHGIQRQLTAAYTPQQNGVAERKNRTILNMVRSMMVRQNLPKTFWPEAVNWSVHILNRSPTFAVKAMTPEEAWSNRKPFVAHFKIFGCIGYTHVPDSIRTKLDDKSKRCIFLGISEESKAFRMYNPITKKLIISRDVRFAEGQTWDWHNTTPNLESSLAAADDTGVNASKQTSIILEEGSIDTVDQPHMGTTSTAQAGATCDTSAAQAGMLTPSSAATPPPPHIEDQPLSSHKRLARRPARLMDYVSGDELSDDDSFAHLALFAGSDPITFVEAVRSPIWKQAMDIEIESIEKNDTWKLTDLPPGEKTVGVQWIYKTKLNEKGEIDKHKARLVAKGYTQEYGIDYTEVFAPVTRLDTIRLVMSLAAQNCWTIFQLDVKSAFLHGELTEPVFIDQPPGYIQPGNEHKVYKLRKALYGLKQAPRAWYSRIEAFFLKIGFKKCPFEQTLFIQIREGGKILIVCLYVDDLIFTGNNEDMFLEFKNSMMKEFDMTDLGRMSYFLGIEVAQTSNGIFICQKKYVQDVLKRFQMEGCNHVYNPIVPGCHLTKDVEGERIDSTLYKQIIGSLMYLSATRPDIMYVTSLLSRFMEEPTMLHFQAAKRVLRYLKGTSNFGILYKREKGNNLVGYSDSDYAGDLEDRKSTSGYVFFLNSGAISWSSKKQPVVSLSTTEAEYIAAASCACQAIWLRRLLENLKYVSRGPTAIHCDNSSAIQLSKNPVLHGKSKHIDIRFHFLRELTKEGTVELIYCQSSKQIADIFTKPLKLETFVRLRGLLGVCSESEIN